MKSSNRPYLPLIDFFRAAAALTIVFYHVYGGFIAYHPPLNKFESDFSLLNPYGAFVLEGHTGVSLFMVLSGFTLSHGIIGSKIYYHKFLFNRLLRIYPLFFTVICLAALVKILIYSKNIEFKSLLLSFALLQNFEGAFSHLYIGHLWTIAVEFHFYLTFPFFIALLRLKSVNPIFFAIGLTLLVRVFCYFQIPEFYEKAFYTIIGRLDQFLIGMVLSWWLSENRNYRINLFFAWLALILGLMMFRVLGGLYVFSATMIFWPIIEGLLWGLALAATIQGNVYNYFPKNLKRLGLFSGLISYSIYIWHYPIALIIAQNGLVSFSGNYNWDVFFNTIFIILPVVYLASAVSFFLIERPFLKYRLSYLAKDNH